jgi:uncharacterized protein YjbI with pentapeptide repeats
MKSPKLTPPDVDPDLQDLTDRRDLLSDDAHVAVRLDGMDLGETAIEGLDIRASELKKVTMAQARYEKLKLSDSTMTDCSITTTTLAQTEWRYVAVRGSRFGGVQMQRAHLKHVLFDNCMFDVVNFRFAKLESVVFRNCVLREADWYNAVLKQVAFEDCELVAPDFTSMSATGVDMSSSQLADVRGFRGLGGVTISSLQLVTLAPYMADELGIRVQD